jgi:hypothetical protein
MEQDGNELEAVNDRKRFIFTLEPHQMVGLHAIVVHGPGDEFR